MKKKYSEEWTLEYLGLTEAPDCRCGRKRTWNRHDKTTPFGGYRLHCSLLCMQTNPETHIKRTITIKERYGVDHYSKVQEFPLWTDAQKAQYRERAEATFMEKYGVKWHMQTPEYLEKREKTNLERYGV